MTPLCGALIISAALSSFISVSETRLGGNARTEEEAQKIALEKARRCYCETFGGEPNICAKGE